MKKRLTYILTFTKELAVLVRQFYEEGCSMLSLFTLYLAMAIFIRKDHGKKSPN